MIIIIKTYRKDDSPSTDLIRIIFMIMIIKTYKQNMQESSDNKLYSRTFIHYFLSSNSLEIKCCCKKYDQRSTDHSWISQMINEKVKKCKNHPTTNCIPGLLYITFLPQTWQPQWTWHLSIISSLCARCWGTEGTRNVTGIFQ